MFLSYFFNTLGILESMRRYYHTGDEQNLLAFFVLSLVEVLDDVLKIHVNEIIPH
jgi:hypothetical protein